MNTLERAQGVIDDGRIYWLDNLRTFMIFLVVVCHTSGVYESSGGWGSFWIVDDPSTNNMSGLVFLILDIFVMPTIFFVSGFFAPLSMKDRSWQCFLISKFKRLMVPWIVAALTLIPLYKVIFLHSRGLPQESWTTYFHWSNGIWSQNWLWFLPVLFLFNILYLAISKVKIGWPSFSLKGAVLGAFVIGFVYSFSMDVLGLRGWTKTVLIDFQNERMLIYFLAFALGGLCFRRGVLESKPKGKKLYILVNSVAWIPMNIYVFSLLYPWFKPGSFIIHPVGDRVMVWLGFHLSLLCMMYLMIETFRRYFNKAGIVRGQLNRNSYYVYIIHVIVIGVIALGLLDSAMPSVLKYFVLTVSTYVVCNLMVYFCRKASIVCVKQGRIL